MIHPTDEQLLSGIAEALDGTVLPDLARGSAARKQLRAAIEILQRIAFAGPDKAAALAADNADMAEVIARIEAILSCQSPQPNLPHQGRGTRSNALPLDGGGLGGGDAAARNKALQARLSELQESIPQDLARQINPLLAALYGRMTDRALDLIPPPIARPPRTSP
jgi:hypothetical protein